MLQEGKKDLEGMIQILEEHKAGTQSKLHESERLNSQLKQQVEDLTASNTSNESQIAHLKHQLEEGQDLNRRVISSVSSERDTLRRRCGNFENEVIKLKGEVKVLTRRLETSETSLSSVVKEKDKGQTQLSEEKEKVLLKHKRLEADFEAEKCTNDLLKAKVKELQKENASLANGEAFTDRTNELIEVKMALAQAEFEREQDGEDKKALKSKYNELRDAFKNNAKQLTQMEVRLVRAEKHLAENIDEMEGLNAVKQYLSTDLAVTKQELEEAQEKIRVLETHTIGQQQQQQATSPST
eukprot:GFYU01010423.1.p1 GENE.GFYU01010423.1~~GFYU01010423.1.p1  ORF type:complete len:326 (-),score=104.07 GFYU01010423.1:101-991(-)